MNSKTTLFGTVLQRVALGFVAALGLLSILASGGGGGGGGNVEGFGEFVEEVICIPFEDCPQERSALADDDVVEIFTDVNGSVWIRYADGTEEILEP